MDLKNLQKSKVVSELSKQVILIYGRAKIGKSTLCSQFEKPLFLATEAGLGQLEVYKVDCNSWIKFAEACKTVGEGNHDFKTIVIDTIDNLVVFCSDYICKKNGINHPSELPHGKGWNLVTSELKRVMIKLSNLPYGLVMISHCVKEEVETKTKKYNRWTIDVSGKNKSIFLNMSDIILFIDSKISADKEEVRLIRTKPSMNWESGDRSGKLPAEIPLNFNELKKYFEK